MKPTGERVENSAPPFFEVLTAKDLAARWRVPESWGPRTHEVPCSGPDSTCATG